LLLAPDNGLLPEALRDCPAVAWRAWTPACLARLGLPPPSRTFHGRDLFAPLAAELAADSAAPEDFGPLAAPADPAPLPRRRATVTACSAGWCWPIGSAT
jgi:S-adenosyl-L-methionine hydrolase (adenosine-forming)